MHQIGEENPRVGGITSCNQCKSTVYDGCLNQACLLWTRRDVHFFFLHKRYIGDKHYGEILEHIRR